MISKTYQPLLAHSIFWLAPSELSKIHFSLRLPSGWLAPYSSSHVGCKARGTFHERLESRKNSFRTWRPASPASGPRFVASTVAEWKDSRA